MRYRTILALSLIASVLAGAAACSSRRTTISKVIEVHNPHTWIGRSVVELAKVWGEAQRRHPDGLGGEVLTYTEVKVYPGSAPLDWKLPQADLEPIGIGVLAGGDAFIAEGIAEFRIDPEGAVYRYRIVPELAELRTLRPPPKNAAR